MTNKAKASKRYLQRQRANADHKRGNKQFFPVKRFDKDGNLIEEISAEDIMSGQIGASLGGRTRAESRSHRKRLRLSKGASGMNILNKVIKKAKDSVKERGRR